MRQMLRLTATVAALLWFGFAHAQTRVIQGTVKDEAGKSVPYMAVQVKGTTIGTYTDTAGKFTLAVDSTARILMLSYPGMATQQVAISDNMMITMKNDALGLSEVVVTAIGIPVEKKALGTATQVVGGDDVNQSGQGNVMNELEGKVSGLTVISSTGDPGAGTYINLRGVTSLTGNNQPLIIIDGVPIDNSINNYDPTFAGLGASGANGNLTGGVQPTNRGLDINPNDIESITVLKGPAATALYGIQAASGALIITTKKGGKGHAGLGIEFNTSESWSTYNKLPDMQNQWGQGSDGSPEGSPAGDLYYGPTAGTSLKKFSWGPPLDSLYWTGAQPSNAGNNFLGSYDPHGAIVEKGAPGWNSSLQQVSPYDKYNFFTTGVSADNNISLSGGSDNASFRMSLGNLHQTGIIPLEKYDKNTFNFSGSISLSKRLKISAGANYTNSVNNKAQQGSNVSGIMLGLLRTPITFDNSNGVSQSDPTNTLAYELPNATTSERDYRGGPGYDNPFWTINQNPYVSDLNRIYGYSQVDYNFINRPKTTVDFTYRLGGDMYLQDDKNVYDIGSNAFPSGAIFITDYINEQLNSDFIATIKHTFSDDFKGTLVLGQNYFNVNSDIRGTQGYNFIIPHFLDLSNASSTQAFESEGGKRTSALYGEAILDYKSQVFLTLTARDETSSTLPVDNDVFFYPSASLAWVFTETMKMSSNKIFPYGKLRISYADVGKDAPTEALQTYYRSASIADGFTSPGIVFPFNGITGFENSSATAVLGNPNLVPEKTNSFEIGTDLGFFQNRISLSFTYYSEKTENGIFSVPVSFASGWGAFEDNAAVVTNQGEEITLNTTPLKLKCGFQWDLGFNWSHNQSEVVSLSPGVNELLIGGFTNGAIEALPGQPFGVIYGTDYIKSGGQLVIDDNPSDAGYGMPIPGSTSQALGNIQPRWIGGMNNQFSFKNFSLGVIVTTRQGGDIWDGTLGAEEYFGVAQETANRGQAVTWGGVLGHLDIQGNVVHNTTTGTAPGPGASNTVATTYSEYYWQNIGSSFVGPTAPNVFDGSYVRISQVNLSFKFPDRWLRKSHFTAVTFTVFANNPVLWTKYPGVDPETSLGGPSNNQGLDYFNNPGTKSYGVRLNLGL